MERDKILYELMLIANDVRTDSKRLIARLFEAATGRDLPESGWIVDEMIAENIGFTSADKLALGTLIKEHYKERG